MKKQLMFLMAILFQAALVFANEDLTGRWKGDGNVTDSNNNIESCIYKFEFNQTDTQLSLISGSYECGFSLFFDPFTLDILGVDLLAGGQKVGTIKDGIIEIDWTTSSTHQIMTWIVAQDNMAFRHDIVLPDGGSTIFIGTLERK